MKLYDCETAPSPRRVRIFAAEKGLELETVAVDLSIGEQFSPEYREINPDCVVPTLQLDDGTCISEVVAICHYLEELQPEPSLFGRTAAERALVLMWSTKAEQQGLWAAADAFRNAAKGLKGRAIPGPDNFEQIPQLAERGRERCGSFLRKMERQLDAQDFIAGDFFSIADITAMVFFDFASRLKVPFPDDGNNLQRWYAAIAARPSAAA